MSGSTPRQQLQFELSAERPDFSRESFLLTPATAHALATGETFLASREPALCICGPAGSGKTHLASILAAEAGAVLSDARHATATAGEVVVVDAMEAAPDPYAVLRLIEETKAAGRKLILVGAGQPGAWARGLRDLRTRLEAMARIMLEEPDEELLEGVIARLFRQRQWRAAAAVPSYAAPRIPRTFAAARAFVEAAGVEAIAAGKPISLALARKVADNLSEAPAKA